ncbi:MAG: calcium-binding protein [Alsobacter sp.]
MGTYIGTTGDDTTLLDVTGRTWDSAQINYINYSPGATSTSADNMALVDITDSYYWDTTNSGIGYPAKFQGQEHPGYDYLAGNGGNDILFNYNFKNFGSTAHLVNFDGGEGDDSIWLYDKFNQSYMVAQGGTGNDEIYGGTSSYAETMDGGSGNDYIVGAFAAPVDGPDSIMGGDDSDHIEGMGGNDTIDGGSGDDGFTLITFGAPSRSGTAYAGLYGGDGNDEIHGGDGNDFVDGGPDNDLVFGDAGKDSLQGGDGNDYVDGGLDNDTVSGGNGDDWVVDNDGANSLSGDAGNDYFPIGPGANTIDGGSDIDTISYLATSGVVVDLQGTIPNGLDAAGEVIVSVENLYGSDVADTLMGDLNDNELRGRLGNDSLSGRGGNDLIVDWRYDPDDLTDGGSDTLDGGAGADTLMGGNGNDVLIGGAGADQLNGGNNVDRASYSTAQVGVIASLAQPGLNTGDAAGDTYFSIENLQGSGQVDTLAGDDGDNRLDGGLGADSLAGGGGNDIYVVENSFDRVIEGLNAGIDTIISSVTLTLGANVENLTLVPAFSINGTGNGLDNIITGNDQVNVLNGQAGNDTLIGGVGNDQLVGGAGADSLVGGSGVQDLASYSTSTLAGGIVVSLTNPSSNTGDALGDNYSGVEGLIGSSFADTLTGTGGANRLQGGAGNDVIDGLAGADTMLGGQGDDTFYVDNTSDGVFENAGEGVDTVYSSVKYTLSSNVDNLLLTGTAGINANGNTLDNKMRGNDQANALNGLVGNDTLDGAGGNDVLIGGVGADSLSGGAGTDTASYSTAATGVVVDLANIALNTGDALGDAYLSIEKIAGSGQNDRLSGDGTANDLNGAGGADTLDGGLGNDTLAGGTGGDLFVFASGYGKDAITDFVAADDTVRLTGLSGVFADGAAAYAASVQVGNDVVLTLDATNSLTFKNILKSALSAADFSVT